MSRKFLMAESANIGRLSPASSCVISNVGIIFVILDRISNVGIGPKSTIF